MGLLLRLHVAVSLWAFEKGSVLFAFNPSTFPGLSDSSSKPPNPAPLSLGQGLPSPHA